MSHKLALLYRASNITTEDNREIRLLMYYVLAIKKSFNISLVGALGIVLELNDVTKIVALEFEVLVVKLLVRSHRRAVVL